MEVNIYLKLGKEINEQTKSVITDMFKRKNLMVNSGKISANDKVGFIIRKDVSDINLFIKNVYQTLQTIPNLYLVAPQHCLNQIKHHPRVHCFDSALLDDPETGVSNLISFAYQGRPL